jgi:hypothetical protein
MKNQNEKSGKRGRPVNPNSPRQQRLNQLAQRVANGELLKRGRPKKQEAIANTIATAA